jgi:hypothetical protein
MCAGSIRESAIEAASRANVPSRPGLCERLEYEPLHAPDAGSGLHMTNDVLVAADPALFQARTMRRIRNATGKDYLGTANSRFTE